MEAGRCKVCRIGNMVKMGAAHKSHMGPIGSPGCAWRVDMSGKVDPVSKHGARYGASFAEQTKHYIWFAGIAAKDTYIAAHHYKGQ